MLIDDGLLVQRRTTAGPRPRYLGSAACRRRSRHCSPRGSTSSTTDERAVIERAAVEGKVFYEGAVVDARAGGPRAARRRVARLARPQGADPARPAESWRADLPLPAPADPRRRLRLDPEGGARRAARALRRLARARARATGRRSTRRWSATTSSRPTATGPSSGPADGEPGRSARGQPSGSAAPAGARSPAPMPPRA